MGRFIPNLVINDTNPFDEDDWLQIHVGEVVFEEVKLCSRCKIITTDPHLPENFQAKIHKKPLHPDRLINEDPPLVKN